jgi:hypothetical protein
MDNRRELERKFDEAMIRVYEGAARNTGFHATRFLQMVRRRGGVEAARLLLSAPGVSAGFMALRRAGHLELTVEAQTLRPRFAGLFTDEELETARQRLADFGYRPDRYPSAD